MVKLFFGTMLIVITLTSCSSYQNQCEDINLVSEQMNQCQTLHRQIVQAKGKPIIRTELERRYQQDCIDLRFYRDDQNASICGDNKEEVKAELKKETN